MVKDFFITHYGNSIDQNKLMTSNSYFDCNYQAKAEVQERVAIVKVGISVENMEGNTMELNYRVPRL